ncbi:MAG: S-methyl-5-thioribose-1-phosphate isomerase [Elusimicrobia bacterium]|nr:S-methyl-5-thioribose-1-phosphate isomerase [Elusimicrobiota bacterium]
MMPEVIYFDRGTLFLLDQRALPRKVRYVKIKTHRRAAWAIKDMVVRGAPAIGIAAAYGYYLGYAACRDKGSVKEHMREVREDLLSSRPTAVNLRWALDRMEEELEKLSGREGDTGAGLLKAADRIKESEIEANMKIGEHGARLLRQTFPGKKKVNILTHCNAGALATGGWGTALGVIRTAFREGMLESVYADETRPRLQGARLTCYELFNEGIPFRMICDNMSGFFMRQGGIDAVVVGADRIAKNGDVANKIGTYMVAVLAARHNIPFFVAAPLSTFDFDTPSGDGIEIEYRDDSEVLNIGGKAICPAGTCTKNPAFDVTPSELVAAYITEKGAVRKTDELQ